MRHPGIVTDVWGPGWKGYDPELSLSANVQRRAGRIEQLERSEEQHEAGIQHRMAQRAKDIRRKERWAKWTLGAVQLDVQEDEAHEPWSAPGWLDEYPEDCGPVKWEVVWTISCVVSIPR